MIQIYHNPRCGKSREGLALLETMEKDIEVIHYMKEGITAKDLTDLIDKLGIKAIDLVRTKEKIWKENYAGKKLSNSKIIQAMVEHPKLIERPIVVKGNKAVVARPAEKIHDIL